MPGIEQISNGMSAFINRLLAAQDIEGDDEYLLVPVRYANDGEYEIRGELYRVEDIRSFAPVLSVGKQEERLENARALQSDDIRKIVKREVPDSYDYLFLPWGEPLSYEVFLPEEIDDDTRVAFVEDVLWELSFLGGTEEKHNAGIAELVNDIEEARDTETSYSSWEEFKEEMGLKHGSEIKKRSPEEEEENKRKIYIELMENELARTRVLLAAKELPSNENGSSSFDLAENVTVPVALRFGGLAMSR